MRGKVKRAEQREIQCACLERGEVREGKFMRNIRWYFFATEGRGGKNKIRNKKYRNLEITISY